MAGADIEITGQEESFGSNGPWVVQHKGCGEKGFVVRVSEEFFTPVKDVLDHHRKGIYQKENETSLILSIYYRPAIIHGIAEVQVWCVQ